MESIEELEREVQQTANDRSAEITYLLIKVLERRLRDEKYRDPNGEDRWENEGGQ